MYDNEMMQYLYGLFDPTMPRLGPGKDELTRKALQAVQAMRLIKLGEAPNRPLRVLDAGCGNGAPTLELARNLQGTILAIDNHAPYLEELQRRAQAEGQRKGEGAGLRERKAGDKGETGARDLLAKIETRELDMNDLTPAMGPFDLIWSEGALNALGGFANALKVCRTLLAPGGCLATSELVWFKPNPPEPARQFFAEGYPPMTDIKTNLSYIREAGYSRWDHFIVPEDAWRIGYYANLTPRLEKRREAYSTSPVGQGFLAMVDQEVETYRKYSDYYGYAFFLMQK